MSAPWPSFDVTRGSPTIATLHLASQLLGKLRVAFAPWVNHGWHVTLHPVASGLITDPTAAADGRSFTLALDLCEHHIGLRVSDGATDRVDLADGLTIADLHREFVAMLDRHGLPSSFHGTPNEIADALPSAEDQASRAYDPASAERLRDMLALIVPIFEKFRAGFWPGNAGMAADPIFYSYAYPEPTGFREAAAAEFSAELGEFVMPYAAVASAADPEATLLAFLESTYVAAADLAHWDRPALERLAVAP